MNLSLIAAALDDTVESLILEKQYTKIGESIKVTGSSSALLDLTEHEPQRQSVYAEKAAKDISNLFEELPGPSCSYSHRGASREAYEIQETCSHEPSSKKKLNTNQRPFPFRAKRNAHVQKSITFAKSANLKLLKMPRSTHVKD